jgi:CRISPR-associated protein (TIGR02584 family)
VLLAVTGLSPQIVTETLYALAVKGKWIPTEIQVITAAIGARNVHDSVLSKKPGWFRRLCEEYDLPNISFGLGSIRVITGTGGQPLDDILTDQDNTAVADFITEQMRELTADSDA